MRSKISDGEKSLVQDSIAITDGTLIPGYKFLNDKDFTISSTDIQNKGMSFADIVASVAPVITAIPPSAPTNPGRNTILRRQYTDLYRTWKYNGTAWSHVYDEIIRVIGQFSLSLVEAQTAVTAAGTDIGDFFIVPTYMNGAEIIEITGMAGSGAGNVAVSLKKNGVGPACFTLAGVTSTLVTQSTCAAIVLATGDKITARMSSLVGSLNGMSITIVYKITP